MLRRLGKSRFWSALAALGFVTAWGCSSNTAGEIWDSTDVGRGVEQVGFPIEGGDVDEESIGVFAAAVDRGEDIGLCTATLIAPSLFVTARHCVSESAREVDCEESSFGTTVDPAKVVLTNVTRLDEAIDEEIPLFRAGAIYLPSQSNICGADVALVETERPVPEEIAVFVEPRLNREVMTGDVFTAVGYGTTNDEGDGAGVRRQRQELDVVCVADGCPDFVASTEFLGETGTCEGDSGGPAIDEDGRIAGVLSRGGQDCSFPVYGSIVAWGDALRAVALEAAERGGYDPPVWANRAGEADGAVANAPPAEADAADADMPPMDGGCTWSPNAPATWSIPVLVVTTALVFRRRQRRAAPSAHPTR